MKILNLKPGTRPITPSSRLVGIPAASASGHPETIDGSQHAGIHAAKLNLTNHGSASSASGIEGASRRFFPRGGQASQPSPRTPSVSIDSPQMLSRLRAKVDGVQSTINECPTPRQYPFPDGEERMNRVIADAVRSPQRRPLTVSMDQDGAAGHSRDKVRTPPSKTHVLPNVSLEEPSVSNESAASPSLYSPGNTSRELEKTRKQLYIATAEQRKL